MRGWVTKTIGEACELVNGGTPKTGVGEFWGGQHQWVTPAEMGKRSSPYIDATERTLTDAGLANCSASPLPSHSVIMSSRAPIGHLVINTVPMSFNQGCKGLIPKPGLDHKFLYYFLLTNVELLNALGTGATFKELSGGKLKEVTLPIPPLAEQKRIIAILDEAFEGIAKATANAERNLANARALVSATFGFQLRQVDEEWIDCTLGDQFTLQRGVDITKSEQKSGNIPVVSSGGIKSFHDTAIAKAPGVVVGRKGSLGTAYFIEEDFWPHDTTLWVKDFKGNDPKFVFFLLRSLDLKSLDSGAANPALNRNNVHPLPVRWPPLNVQQRIVKLLDEVATHSVRIERVLERKIEFLAELKATFLHRAFSGQLTGKEAVAA